MLISVPFGSTPSIPIRVIYTATRQHQDLTGYTARFMVKKELDTDPLDLAAVIDIHIDALTGGNQDFPHGLIVVNLTEIHTRRDRGRYVFGLHLITPTGKRFPVKDNGVFQITPVVINS